MGIHVLVESPPWYNSMHGMFSFFNETGPTKEGEVRGTREENTAPALELPVGGIPTGS